MRDSVLPFLATRGAVFARMRPDMKQRLVEILQDLDFQVVIHLRMITHSLIAYAVEVLLHF